MSYKVSDEVWKHSRGLKAGAKLLLLALAEWCNDNYECWPSMATIALRCDCDEKTASRIVKELEASRYVAVERGGGRSKSSTYTVHPRGNAPSKPPQVMGDYLRGNNEKPPQIKGDKNAQTPANNGGYFLPAYEEEPSGSFDKELTIDEEEEENSEKEAVEVPLLRHPEQVELEILDEIPNTPQIRGAVAGKPFKSGLPDMGIPTSTSPAKDLNNPIRLAVFEVCGLVEGHLKTWEKKELERILVWQWGLFEGDEEASASAIRQRYSRPIWTLPSGVQISQIDERTWARATRNLELQKQDEEMNNGTNHINRAGNSPASGGRQSAAQRKDQGLNEWIGEIIRGDSGDSPSADCG